MAGARGFRRSAADRSGRAGRVLSGLGVAALCVGAALVTSWASLDAWFVGDDLGEIQRALHGDSRGTHTRPVVTVLLRANHLLHGLDPIGYHVVNVALHAAVIGLVAWLAFTLAADRGAAGGRARVMAAASAGTFAVLANHSEVVSWISARGDLIVTGAALLSVGAWVRRDDDRRWVVVAVVATAVALLSKEQAVVIPALCVAVAFVRDRWGWSQLGRAVRDSVPLWCVLGLYVVVRGLVIGSFVGSYEGSGGFDWNPVHLSERFVLMAARSVLPGMATWIWIVLGASGLVLAAMAMADRRRVVAAMSGPPAVAAALTVIAVLPGIGLGVSAHDVRGDRLVYLASSFAAIAVATFVVQLVATLSSRWARRTVVGVAAVALVCSAVAAVDRDRRWGDAGDLGAATLSRGELWDEERPTVVLNPVDTLRGAYVHRNTLGDAGVVVHRWDAPGLVTGAAPMRLADPAAEVRVDQVGERRWVLTIAPGSGEFVTPVEDDAPGVDVALIDGRRAEVDLGTEVDLDAVWFISGGTMHPLRER